MADQKLFDIYKVKMTSEEFNKLSRFIYSEYGIKMPEVKKTMLQSRLQKRLKALNLSSFKEYVDFVFSSKGQAEEVIHMIDVVSTNKTDFFREPVHFEYLNEKVLPEFCATNPHSKHIRVWSAGCSSGEEPYTIAVTLEEYKLKCPALEYNIYATDISSRILKQAADAIYKSNRIDVIPISLRKKYFLKSKDPSKGLVRVSPHLRNKVNFQRLNFMQSSFNVPHKFDVIFCRNVLIYFDRNTQENVINKLCQYLKPGGYFFLGHSESITNFEVPLIQIKPTIFKRK